MFSDSILIVGSSCTGKTARLIEKLRTWTSTLDQGNLSNPNYHNQFRQRPSVESVGREWDELFLPKAIGPQTLAPKRSSATTAGRLSAPCLVLSANGDNRLELADRLVTATEGHYAFYSTTPLGFFEDQVNLFWPLLIAVLNLRAEFPLRLRPENEQELATNLWHQDLETGILRIPGVSPARIVRRLLDLWQLAALSGNSIPQITTILQQSWEDRNLPNDFPFLVSNLLSRWRQLLLEKGLLTYGFICELYAQHLFHHPTYQVYLKQRYQGIFADDIDDYPACIRHLFELLLNQGAIGIFTYNPDGGVRQGLGADPNYLAELESFCQVENLTINYESLAAKIGGPVTELALDNFSLEPSVYLFPENDVKSIQKTTRSELLREVVNVITNLIKSGVAQPQDIAVIFPGVDAIARYTMSTLLAKMEIPVESLNEQRPLSSYPIIRALLTIFALVYPGLGALINRADITEMLIVLSRRLSANNLPIENPDAEGGIDVKIPIESRHYPPVIDAVRAGLLADYCFSPDIEPRLLPVNACPRWDRLGHKVTHTYQQITHWIAEQKMQLSQRLIASPYILLDRAMQKFVLSNGIAYSQLSALRELMETALHYWEIDDRLRKYSRQLHQGQIEIDRATTNSVELFIHLLRQGTISANPFPVRPPTVNQSSVTIANIFQYRSSRLSHKYHFWLDVGSNLWLSGGAANLWASPIFEQHNQGKLWTIADEMERDQRRLQKILLDLLGRVSDRLYLCHSDLATNGTEQNGPLLSLIAATTSNEQLQIITND